MWVKSEPKKNSTKAMGNNRMGRGEGGGEGERSEEGRNIPTPFPQFLIKKCRQENPKKKEGGRKGTHGKPKKRQ